MNMAPVSMVKMVEVGSQINIVQMVAFVSSTNIYVSPMCLELDLILRERQFLPSGIFLSTMEEVDRLFGRE